MNIERIRPAVTPNFDRLPVPGGAMTIEAERSLTLTPDGRRRNPGRDPRDYNGQGHAESQPEQKDQEPVHIDVVA